MFMAAGLHYFLLFTFVVLGFVHNMIQTDWHSYHTSGTRIIQTRLIRQLR